MLTVQLQCDNCTVHTAQTELKQTLLFKFGKLSNKCLDAGPHYNPTNTTHGSLTSPNRSLILYKEVFNKGTEGGIYLPFRERHLCFTIVSFKYYLT